MSYLLSLMITIVTTGNNKTNPPPRTPTIIHFQSSLSLVSCTGLKVSARGVEGGPDRPSTLDIFAPMARPISDLCFRTMSSNVLLGNAD